MSQHQTEQTEPEQTEPASTTQQTDDQTPKPSASNREAARYRVQLRDTEAKLAAATERLTRIERAQAEAEAAKHLAVAADLFTLGNVDLDDLRDDDGNVSPERVQEAAQELLTARPGLAVVPPRLVSFDGGARQTVPREERGPTYADVLRGGAA